LEQIYSAHFSLTWRGLRRLGVPPALLEDAVQDVFLVVHRRRAEFEGRSSLQTWLYGIVLRVAKDYRRAQARHASRVDRMAEHLVSDPAPGISPADEAERREANRVLHAVLAKLKERDREVLVLVDLEELSAREAAQALGIRVRTCQRRLRAARAAFDAALRSYLEPDRRFTR
jgi:RNA polymerase sigma-70 factor (ECF subfamily)